MVVGANVAPVAAAADGQWFMDGGAEAVREGSLDLSASIRS